MPASRCLPLLLLSLAPLLVSGAPDSPGVWPVCPSPQPLAAPQPIGAGYANARAAVVWNGADYGVFWTDGYTAELHFRRVFADGTLATDVVRIPSGGGLVAIATSPPQAVWTGSQYAVAWTVFAAGAAHAYFSLVSPAGAAISGPTRVSNLSGSPTPSLTVTDLAQSGVNAGNVFLVLWQEDKGTGASYDVSGTILSSGGAVSYPDLLIDGLQGDQQDGRAVWLDTNNCFAVVTTYNQDYLKARPVYPYGSLGASMTLVDTLGAARRPDLLATPAGNGMIWVDTRDGNEELYFGMLANGANGLTYWGRITNNGVADQEPQLAWTGAEFLAAFQSLLPGHFEIYAQRIDSDAAPLGAPARLTHTAESNYPAIGRGNSGYLLTSRQMVSATLVTPVGCAADATPPACGGNYIAYAVTGTGATVAWSPSSDPESDLAYYAVYRNDALVARTSQTAYSDGGLSPSGTYNYLLQPVNASQLQNTACTASIYVRTNASLTLSMSKANANDAALGWTDAGFNNYNVFRGTSPQVMSQIASTPALSSTDPGVLGSPLSFFYSVDNPGP